MGEIRIVSPGKTWISLSGMQEKKILYIELVCMFLYIHMTGHNFIFRLKLELMLMICQSHLIIMLFCA